MNFIRLHSVSFGGGPGSNIDGKDLPAILHLGSHPNEFHSVSFGGGPGSKIDGKDLPAILDIGLFPNETE